MIQNPPPGTPLTEDERALVEANMGLVYNLVYRGGRTSRDDDRVQAGMLGLMRAAQLFDPELGFRFSTYAERHIRAAVQRERRTEGAIHIPAYLHHVGGWADESNPGHVARARQAVEASRVSSLDAPGDDDAKFDVPQINDPGRRIEDDDQAAYRRAHLERALGSLRERERDVVLSVAMEGQTLATVGKRYGVTHEAVRQIQLRAFTVLRLQLLEVYAKGA